MARPKKSTATEDTPVGVEENTETQDKEAEVAERTPTTPVAPEGYVSQADVQKMIKEALANIEDKSGPRKIARVKEHFAHAWRLDGKWVVDFVDQNTDPYRKRPVFAFNKFNDQKRQVEAWIVLKFHDDSMKEIPLVTYVQNRLPVYCKIIKRHQKDVSYSIGEVEKKKELGDKLIGTGVVVDQEVQMYETTFELMTPEGITLMLPEYVIA